MWDLLINDAKNHVPHTGIEAAFLPNVQPGKEGWHDVPGVEPRQENPVLSVIGPDNRKLVNPADFSPNGNTKVSTLRAYYVERYILC